MIETLHPALILTLGAALVPVLPGRIRDGYLLALPVLALLQLLSLGQGSYGELQLFGHGLTLLRLDGLSFAFALLFHIAAFLVILFGLSVRDPVQQCAALIYAGAAIGAVLAGDLITLFVCWELTAVASVFLIWARRSERAYRVGLRYLLVQVSSGLLLLAGVIAHSRLDGGMEFARLGLDSAAGQFIFIAFGIKAAFPLLHNWLADAYPEATATGTVVLSAFTTKLAIYALARGYAGEAALLGIGAVMAVFPVFYALLENDLRRVLAYSLNSQLGYMVIAVGVGTELALDGAVAQAYTHTLYKALLFMSMGAVLVRAGSTLATDIGGLGRNMPFTAACCVVGAASICALPLTGGFVSKAMILAALGKEGHLWPWLAALFASVAVVLYAGLRLPLAAFFSPGRGINCQEAPGSMRLAMGLTALACIGLGLYPAALYGVLPFGSVYQPYSAGHVLGQLQLLVFAVLAYVLMARAGWLPEARRGLHLDSDWSYRRLLPALVAAARAFGAPVDRAMRRGALMLVDSGLRLLDRHWGAKSTAAGTWLTGSMVLWVTVLLCGYLFFYYL